MLLSITVISLKEQLILLCIPARLIMPGLLSRPYLLAVTCPSVPPKSFLCYQRSLSLRWISLHCQKQSGGLGAKNHQNPLEGQTLPPESTNHCSQHCYPYGLSKRGPRKLCPVLSKVEVSHDGMNWLTIKIPQLFNFQEIVGLGSIAQLISTEKSSTPS